MDLQTTRHLEQLLHFLGLPGDQLEPVMIFERDQGKMIFEINNTHICISLHWNTPINSENDLLLHVLTTLSPGETGGFPMRVCLFQQYVCAQVTCPLPLFKARLGHRLLTRLVECIRRQLLNIDGVQP